MIRLRRLYMLVRQVYQLTIASESCLSQDLVPTLASLGRARHFLSDHPATSKKI